MAERAEAEWDASSEEVVAEIGTGTLAWMRQRIECWKFGEGQRTYMILGD